MIKMTKPFGSTLERFRAVGLRPTRQRLALGKLLFEDGDRHTTAEQLHADAMDAKVRISLATVYNALHQFTEAGLLRELVVESGRSYFDTNTSPHHHFFCEDTGQLEDIMDGRFAGGGLPKPPPGTRITGVDLVVRVRRQEQE